MAVLTPTIWRAILMANMIRKFARKLGGHRNKSGYRDHKTWALYDAGARVLARHDYDNVSMARLAKEAGCSVGALYNRFSTKESFLHRLAAEVFQTLTGDAKIALDGVRSGHGEGPFLVKTVVSHVVQRMTTRRVAGVIRAAMKLAPAHPITLELFEDYRAAITAHAVDLLAPHVEEGDAKRIRIAMQIVLATVTDAILQKKPGPLQAGSARMTEALTKVVTGYLGLANGQAWAGDEADGEDVPRDDTAETGDAPEMPPGRAAVYDPDMHVFRGVSSIAVKPRKSSRARFVRSNSASKSAVHTVTATKPPSRAATEPETDDSGPVRKRKHRFI